MAKKSASRAKETAKAAGSAIKKAQGINPLLLTSSEQTSIRILLAQREMAHSVGTAQIEAAQNTAKAAVGSANNAIRTFLIHVLNGRQLDPEKWGIAPDMTTIIEIVQPPAEETPAGTDTFAATPEPAAQIDVPVVKATAVA